MNRYLVAAAIAFCFSLFSCSHDSEVDPIIDPVEPMLYVVNSGTYTYSNSSITAWLGQDGSQQELFFHRNGFKLGDVAQSMTFHNGTGWIVVNNSNVIFAVDADFKEIGRIDQGLISPRYIHFISDDKAYVTQMYSNEVMIVNPKSYQVTGSIKCGGNHHIFNNGNTEQMVQIGDFVYINCWSYDNRIIKIDTRTDKMIAEVEVGIQPCSIVKDANNQIWTICDGGWDGNPLGHQAPTLVCIDPYLMKVKSRMEMTKGDYISGTIVTNRAGNRLFWIRSSFDSAYQNIGGVYEMDINAETLPSDPLIPAGGRQLTAVTVSPYADYDIFVADAIDYQQNGIVYRYDSFGRRVGQFTAGIIPTSFAWDIH